MDKKELMEELEGLKKGLETSIEAKALTQIETKLKEYKSAIDKQIEELKASDKTAEELKGMKAAFDELKEKSDKTIEAFDKMQLKFKSGQAPEKVKSFGDELADVFDKKHDDIQKFMRKETKRMDFDLKAVADVSTANVTGGSVWGSIYKPGIIMNPNTIGHARSFIPVSSAGSGTDYYFMKENGAGEGAPTTVKEKQAASATNAATGLKPQFDVDLVESSVKFEIIAGYMIASNKALSNIPSFLSFLQARVPQKLMDVEDYQVLYGGGTSPDLSGIFNTGNYIDGSTSSTVLAERILDDLAVLEDTHKRLANVIAMRPLEYWSFFKNKADGSGEYNLPSNVVFANGTLYIGGVPVVKTTALTSGDYLIGANMGAEILQQEAMRLEFFREDGTNARTNQVTIRIEEVIALPIYGSNYFIKGAVPNA